MTCAARGTLLGMWYSQLWTTQSPSGVSVPCGALPAHPALRVPAGTSTPQMPIHPQGPPNHPPAEPLQTQTLWRSTQLPLVMRQAGNPTQQQQESHQQQVQAARPMLVLVPLGCGQTAEHLEGLCVQAA